jgi:hypothetical protein
MSAPDRHVRKAAVVALSADILLAAVIHLSLFNLQDCLLDFLILMRGPDRHVRKAAADKPNDLLLFLHLLLGSCRTACWTS